MNPARPRRPSVITAVPTAFTPDGDVDLAGTARIMRHALDGGVDSLFLAGTTAEFPALTIDEVAAIVRAGLDLAGPGRVIAHVGGASARQAQELARRVVGMGVTSLAAITPYYLPAGREAVFEYFTAIRGAVGDARLYAYLFPQRTGVHLDSDETAELVEALDLEGIKLSGLDTDYVARSVSKLSGGRRVYSGSDGSISRVFSVGGAGVVSGVSAAFPRPFTRLADALEAQDPAAEQRWQARVDRAVGLVGPSIRALKRALVAQGVVDTDACRMALDRLTEPALRDIGLLVADAARWESVDDPLADDAPGVGALAVEPSASSVD